MRAVTEGHSLGYFKQVWLAGLPGNHPDTWIFASHPKLLLSWHADPTPSTAQLQARPLTAQLGDPASTSRPQTPEPLGKDRASLTRCPVLVTAQYPGQRGFDLVEELLVTFCWEAGD